MIKLKRYKNRDYVKKNNKKKIYYTIKNKIKNYFTKSIYKRKKIKIKKRNKF